MKLKNDYSYEAIVQNSVHYLRELVTWNGEKLCLCLRRPQTKIVFSEWLSTRMFEYFVDLQT